MLYWGPHLLSRMLLIVDKLVLLFLCGPGWLLHILLVLISWPNNGYVLKIIYRSIYLFLFYCYHFIYILIYKLTILLSTHFQAIVTCFFFRFILKNLSLFKYIYIYWTNKLNSNVKGGSKSRESESCSHWLDLNLIRRHNGWKLFS